MHLDRATTHATSPETPTKNLWSNDQDKIIFPHQENSKRCAVFPMGWPALPSIKCMLIQGSRAIQPVLLPRSPLPDLCPNHCNDHVPPESHPVCCCVRFWGVGSVRHGPVRFWLRLGQILLPPYPDVTAQCPWCFLLLCVVLQNKNSLGQDPCTIGSTMDASCRGLGEPRLVCPTASLPIRIFSLGTYNYPPINSSEYYLPPRANHSGDLTCDCNTVMYRSDSRPRSLNNDRLLISLLRYSLYMACASCQEGEIYS